MEHLSAGLKISFSEIIALQLSSPNWINQSRFFILHKRSEWVSEANERSVVKGRSTFRCTYRASCVVCCLWKVSSIFHQKVHVYLIFKTQHRWNRVSHFQPARRDCFGLESADSSSGMPDLTSSGKYKAFSRIFFVKLKRLHEFGNKQIFRYIWRYFIS